MSQEHIDLKRWLRGYAEKSLSKLSLLSMLRILKILLLNSSDQLEFFVSLAQERHKYVPLVWSSPNTMLFDIIVLYSHRRNRRQDETCEVLFKEQSAIHQTTTRAQHKGDLRNGTQRADCNCPPRVSRVRYVHILTIVDIIIPRVIVTCKSHPGTGSGTYTSTNKL
jgi:hypothetical protein